MAFWPLGNILTPRTSGRFSISGSVSSLTMIASFLLCCFINDIYSLTSSNLPSSRPLCFLPIHQLPLIFTSFLMGPRSHGPSHTTLSASISESQGEHTGITLSFSEKRLIFFGNSPRRVSSTNKAAFAHPSFCEVPAQEI